MSLKRIMTDLAAGHITQEEADILINEEKVDCGAPVQEIEAPQEEPVVKTQKRRTKSKKVLKNQELS